MDTSGMSEEWETEPDELFWLDDKTKIPCAINRTEFSGHLCGYCGFNSLSYFYNKEYGHKILMKEAENYFKQRTIKGNNFGIIDLFCGAMGDSCKEEGNEMSADIGLLIPCHGGITYSGGGSFLKVPEEYKNYWWFGFDCNHLGDLAPKSPSSSCGNKYRNIKYVTENITTMAMSFQKLEEEVNDK